MDRRRKIVRKIWVLICCVAVASCATPSVQKIDQTRYEFLFEKDLHKDLRDKCIAAYHAEGFLYLVTKMAEPIGIEYVTVYDPKTGVFANTALNNKNKNITACHDVDFYNNEIVGGAALYFIESPEFRETFNRFHEDPEKLKAVIDTGPSFVRSDFRYEGKWNGKRTALALNKVFPTNGMRISAVTERMKRLTTEQVAAAVRESADRAEKQQTPPTLSSGEAAKGQEDPNTQRDGMGRKIIRGPVGSGVYNNVHIISDSVGVQGDSVTVTDSIIEAPVCVRTLGYNTRVINSDLRCNLCIEFTGRVLLNNVLAEIRCAGKGTNRPDVFGW